MSRYLLTGLLVVASACGWNGNGLYYRLYFMNPTLMPLDVPTLVRLDRKSVV